MSITNDFEVSLQLWTDTALFLAERKEAYRAAHARAYLSAEKATEAMRKAQADVATSELRLARDKAEINERAAYHVLIKVRGSAGESERGAA